MSYPVSTQMLELNQQKRLSPLQHYYHGVKKSATNLFFVITFHSFKNTRLRFTVLLHSLIEV